MTTLSTHRLKLLAIAREAGDRWYDPATHLCLISRDTLWYGISLLCDSSEERRTLGDRLLSTSRSEDGTHTPATMLAVLHCIRERVSAAAAEHLEQEITRELVHAAETQWRDGNVNHPLGAYCTLVLGGELASAPWARELGRRRLEEFQRLTGDRTFRHHRVAEMSEYNSLTYTALDILFLALVAEYARSADVRALALFLEERLWLDVALHFHAPSAQFAGPHSRSYQDDSTGGFSALHTVLYAASERELFLHPELCTRFNHPSTLLQCALSAVIPTHCPEPAARLCWEKPFPLLVQKTTYCEHYHENSHRSDGTFAFDDEVYSGGLRELTTYMTREYALGTASLPYVNGGHADSFMLRIRRSAEIRGMGDFRSMYTRGVFNGAVLGRRNRCHVAGKEIDESFLYEEGRCATYQHRNRAIVFYAPKRAGHLGVRSFRMDLIFSFFAPLSALVLGDSPLREFPGMRSAAAPLFFQDFQTYGAIFPLGPDPASRESPTRLSVENDHMRYSLYNYEGPPRDFTREEIALWRTGFVLELATAEEFPSFDSFLAHARRLDINEVTAPGGIRTVRLTTPEGVMCAVYDPLREQFLSRSWNDQEESVEHLRIEGGPEALPLITPLTLFGTEAMQENH